MDPFTQRMLERARARQEKINQKLADSGQTPKRKPLSENLIKSPVSPANSPSKPTRTSISSPRRSTNEPVKSISSVKSPNRPSNDAKSAKTPNKRTSMQKSDQLVVASPQKSRNDVIVTRREFKSPKSSLTRRNSDVSVEINISHRNDIQIEVQVEEREAPISVVYDSQAISGSNVIIQEIEDVKPTEDTSRMEKLTEVPENKGERGGLRNNTKSRLNRLGNLYSDNPHLSSPIHRTEQEFTSETPPSALTPRPPRVEEPLPQGKKKFGRLAALADQINNWEDDLSHHQFHPEPTKKGVTKPAAKQDESTLDVSIHSINDINKALQTTKSKQTGKPINSHTFTRPTNECQRLGKQIVAELIECGDLHKLSQTTVSKIVANISQQLALKLGQFIKFPQSAADIAELKRKFYDIASFPGVIGCIDCTHVPIKSPSRQHGETFRNRKGGFSINVQLVCGPNLEIFDIVARWPGSVHDSRIFANSRCCMNFEEGNMQGILLGDSGYAQTNFMYTPVLNPQSPEEHRYNRAHIQTRNTVERLNGVIKRKFACLSRKLQHKLENIVNIIVACAVLQNISVLNQEEFNEEILSEEEFPAVPAPVNERGSIIRSAFIARHFR